MNQEAFVAAWNDAASDVNLTANQKGWWKKRNAIIELCRGTELSDFAMKLIITQALALVHTEISEGVEGLRKDLMDDKCPEFPMVVVEAADAVIRLMDLAREFNWPLAEAIAAKMQMNAGRPYLHGGKAF